MQKLIFFSIAFFSFTLGCISPESRDSGEKSSSGLAGVEQTAGEVSWPQDPVTVASLLASQPNDDPGGNLRFRNSTTDSDSETFRTSWSISTVRFIRGANGTVPTVKFQYNAVGFDEKDAFGGYISGDSFSERKRLESLIVRPGSVSKTLSRLGLGSTQASFFSSVGYDDPNKDFAKTTGSSFHVFGHSELPSGTNKSHSVELYITWHSRNQLEHYDGYGSESEKKLFTNKLPPFVLEKQRVQIDYRVVEAGLIITKFELTREDVTETWGEYYSTALDILENTSADEMTAPMFEYLTNILYPFAGRLWFGTSFTETSDLTRMMQDYVNFDMKATTLTGLFETSALGTGSHLSDDDKEKVREHLRFIDEESRRANSFLTKKNKRHPTVPDLLEATRHLSRHFPPNNTLPVDKWFEHERYPIVTVATGQRMPGSKDTEWTNIEEESPYPFWENRKER